MVEIKGRYLLLREITPDDLPILFKWRNDPRFMQHCSTRRNEVIFEKYEEELLGDLKRDRHIQCLILKNDLVIGTIYDYGLNLTDGYVFVTIFLEKEFEGRSYGPEAFALFTLFLFENFPLYKIYMDVYSYNQQSLDTIKTAGFIEEGRFQGHRLYNGRRYDLVRFAFFRTRLLELKDFVRRLTINTVRC